MLISRALINILECVILLKCKNGYDSAFYYNIFLLCIPSMKERNIVVYLVYNSHNSTYCKIYTA